MFWNPLESGNVGNTTKIRMQSALILIHAHFASSSLLMEDNPRDYLHGLLVTFVVFQFYPKSSDFRISTPFLKKDGNCLSGPADLKLFRQSLRLFIFISDERLVSTCSGSLADINGRFTVAVDLLNFSLICSVQLGSLRF